MMPGPSSVPPLDLLGDLVVQARKAGAEAADAVLIDSVSLSVGMRLGELERLERAEAGDVGLRILLGKRQAFVRPPPWPSWWPAPWPWPASFPKTRGVAWPIPPISRPTFPNWMCAIRPSRPPNI